jgi:hypothetical protein
MRLGLDEAEPRGVRRQSGVRALRPEVEPSGVAMKALARRRDPLRIGMRGEQPRLVGVGADPARDADEEAGLFTRRSRHASESEAYAGLTPQSHGHARGREAG